MATQYKIDTSRPKPDRIFLFDVDGTLTAPRKEVSSAAPPCTATAAPTGPLHN
jgi:hypothetical protein